MNSKLKLWQIGLIVFILGGLLNTVFMKAGVSGLFRELSRLFILTGLVVLVIGLIKRK